MTDRINARGFVRRHTPGERMLHAKIPPISQRMNHLYIGLLTKPSFQNLLQDLLVKLWLEESDLRLLLMCKFSVFSHYGFQLHMPPIRSLCCFFFQESFGICLKGGKVASCLHKTTVDIEIV